jgi:hypothetical protein
MVSVDNPWRVLVASACEDAPDSPTKREPDVMIIDRYTKFILSIIAAALVMIAVQSSIGTAHAGKEISKIAICDAKHPDRCAQVAPHGFLYAAPDEPY